jgi:uncharacterized protein YceK
MKRLLVLIVMLVMLSGCIPSIVNKRVLVDGYEYECIVEQHQNFCVIRGCYSLEKRGWY